MLFTDHFSDFNRTLIAGITVRHVQIFAFALLSFDVQALNPSQVFDKVKKSIVVVKTLDTNGRAISQGSGVLLPSGKIGTNCHVVKGGASFQVGGGKEFVMAILWGSDEDKDICLLEAKGLNAKPAQLGQAMRLKVGESVYAVGAPKGLEFSISNGIVSQLRGGTPPLIQTTAAISPGSSGGGLFNADGRLVGFTTLYIEGAQSLNFAMPVEWAEEIQHRKKAAQGRSQADWSKRAVALEEAQNWVGLQDWCRQWTQTQPENALAWFCLGAAYSSLNRHAEAIETYRESLRINPADSHTWGNLGAQYLLLKRYTESIDHFREAVRLDPDNERAWQLLGQTYLYELRSNTEAIDPFRQATRINPNNVGAWAGLVVAYEASGNRSAALEAASQWRRVDPAGADEMLSLMKSRR